MFNNKYLFMFAVCTSFSAYSSADTFQMETYYQTKATFTFSEEDVKNFFSQEKEKKKSSSYYKTYTFPSEDNSKILLEGDE